MGHSLNIFIFDRIKLVYKSTITKLIYYIFLIQVTKISIFIKFEPTQKNCVVKVDSQKIVIRIFYKIYC